MTTHNLDPTLSKLSKTAIILLSTALLIGLGAAETFTVNEASDTGDFSSIQKAIDEAAANDEKDSITLHDESYELTSQLVIDNPINLESQDGATAKIVNKDLTETDSRKSLIKVESENVDIRNLEVVQESMTSTPPVDIGVLASEVTVENVHIDRNDNNHGAPGIASPGISDSNINGLEIRNNDLDGASIMTAAGGDGDVEIVDNEISNVADEGIAHWKGDVSNTGFTVKGNTITNYDSADGGKQAIKFTSKPGSLNGVTGLEEQQESILSSNGAKSVKIDGSVLKPVINVDTGNSYKTLSTAVNKANSGNSVEILNGTYREDVEIDVKNLELKSASEDRRPTISYTGEDGPATIDVFAKGVTIEGLNVERTLENDFQFGSTSDQFTQGIRISRSDVTIEDVKVSGPRTNSMQTAGIHVLDGDSSGKDVEVSDVRVMDSKVSGFATGMSVAEWYDESVKNITFNENQLSSNIIGISVGVKEGVKKDPQNLKFRENTIKATPIGLYAIGSPTEGFRNFDSSVIHFNGNKLVNTPKETIDLGADLEPVANLESMVVLNNGGKSVINSASKTLDAERNYWGESSGPEEARIEGPVDWKPYYPTEEAYENGNSFESYQGFLSSFDDVDENTQKSESEIRSIAQDVASGISTMNQQEVQSIVESEVDGFVTEDEFESELNDREETIEDQEETIEEQEERIEELESEVEQLSDQMNQTLEVLEENDQAEVETGPTGQFTVTNPEEEDSQGQGNQGVGGILSGLFG